MFLWPFGPLVVEGPRAGLLGHLFPRARFTKGLEVLRQRFEVGGPSKCVGSSFVQESDSQP